ncbi:MAG: ECF-type sigma factor [Holophagales bacterium]|nr:ECF-type sigma factor [Holophagales bacterium]
MQSTANVTLLLLEWNRGSESAREQLLSAVYTELRNLARRRLRRERLHHTLHPTDLVHEAYLRLIEQARVTWHDRAQFFAVASQMMRRILVDHARKRQAKKRGGKETRLELNEARDQVAPRSLDLVALDDALRSLAQLDARQAQVVELRFFGGMSIEEISEVLCISPATVKRDWSSARAWLFHELRER